MDYAAVAVILWAVFMLGFVVGVVFGRWVPENRTEIHAATLDELRTELRSIQDEPWTDQQLIDWKETFGEAFREAIAKQDRDPENPDAVLQNAESALKGLSEQVERLNRWVMSTPVAGFSARIEKLEGAASEFCQRIEKIEERLSQTVATAIAPPNVDFWREYARKASDAKPFNFQPEATSPEDEEVFAGVTRRELNESKAAAKLLGQLLRDARLQSPNGDFPEGDPRIAIKEFESGELLPYSDTIDRMIAFYKPNAVLKRQIRDAWEIAQKPYLFRVPAETKANEES